MQQVELKSDRKYLKNIVFICVLLGVVTFLYVLSQNPQPRPELPQNGKCDVVTDWNRCFDCHGEGKQLPLKKTHPINHQKCFRCHAVDGKTE